MEYEVVVGLETHIELSTKSKIFCGCSTKFGAAANSNCCPICLGVPGTLPKLNKKVVTYAIMVGLATHCEIARNSKMDRKNYVYPDLSKAYQISQYDKPICEHGHIVLGDGKKIRINRIHIEEDAGKLIHEDGEIFIDYNRGGVPLIEIVTEPDFNSSSEVVEYLETLQSLTRYLGVSDCKMQEGSLRCDVNISVRKKGSSEFGTRIEIKNMNSFTNIAKAIEFEKNRQIEELESGKSLIQQTRRFDDAMGSTQPMREKENANDYRYFKEPDLVTIAISDEEIEALKKEIPELAEAKKNRFVEEFGIPEKDAKLLVKYFEVANFFEKSVEGTKSQKVCANLILTIIFSKLKSEEQKQEFKLKVTPEKMNELLKLVESGKINNNLAKKTLDEMLESGKSVREILSEEDLAGISESELSSFCEEAIKNNAKAVADYANGKDKAIMAVVGYVMGRTSGRANAVEVEKIIKELIKK